MAKKIDTLGGILCPDCGNPITSTPHPKRNMYWAKKELCLNCKGEHDA